MEEKNPAPKVLRMSMNSEIRQLNHSEDLNN